MNKYISDFMKIYKEISKTYNKQLPLCAAENIMSDFVKLPLSTSLQEKYLLGSAAFYDDRNNFLGSEKLFPLYELISEECHQLFNSQYAEARTLSGLNAILTILMSIFDSGDKLLITSIECGGHSSLELFCKRLGLKTDYIPYDYKALDFNYEKVNYMLDSGDYKGIVICLSDIAFEPDIKKLSLPYNCTLIYDITQTMGLIAGKANNNPFNYFKDNENVIILGATHKTLPGPTCGLIMTRNPELSSKFDNKVNPDYLRNIQLHQIASLILTLAEFNEFGENYSSAIINNSECLGQALSNYGFDVIKKNNIFSNTHQLFISTQKNKITSEDCAKFGISLNFRNKPIYKGEGIRIGVQEITRFGYRNAEMEEIAYILYQISKDNYNSEEIFNLINSLTNKRKLSFCFNSYDYNNLKLFLHNNKF